MSDNDTHNDTPQPKKKLSDFRGSRGMGVKGQKYTQADYEALSDDELTPWMERRRNGYVLPQHRKSDPLAPLPAKTETQNSLAEVRRLAREYTERAMQVLLHIAENGRNETAKVAAAKDILDRGWGKAIQVTEEKPQVATNIAISFPMKIRKRRRSSIKMRSIR